MRGLAYTNAWAIDVAKPRRRRGRPRTRAQELADLLTPITKAWCTDLGSELTRLATQVHGGMGYVGETGVEQHERDIRIAAIYEGTNGIQAMDLVGRKLPMRMGGVVGDQIDADRGDCRPAGAGRRPRRPWPRSSPTASPRCGRRRDWLLAKGVEDPQNALAGATPYLRLFGTVLGGWFLARQALAARAVDDDFHRAKVATARYYCEQVLPQARALVPAVTAGPAPLYAIPTSSLASS